jgi:hypothetical protein
VVGPGWVGPSVTAAFYFKIHFSGKSDQALFQSFRSKPAQGLATGEVGLEHLIEDVYRSAFPALGDDPRHSHNESCRPSSRREGRKLLSSEGSRMLGESVEYRAKFFHLHP